ncbi:hypothetical protein AAHC03_020650 [Spirometra sp. Aus1]
MSRSDDIKCRYQEALTKASSDLSSSYCFKLVNDSSLRTSSKLGQGSLLVAMSQTTLDKPVAESFSDDNVGGSPRTELLNSPTKERTASSADADGESRGISSASSPFSPSSAPLSAENGLGRCSLTTQDSGVDETLDEVLEEERTRAAVAGANRKLREEEAGEEEGDYAGWVIEEKAREVFTLGTTSACPASMASPSSPVAVSTETAANGDNLESSSSDRRETRLRRRRRRSRICPPAPPSSSGRAVEISKSSAKQSSSDGDTKASAVETGASSSRSIAEKRHRAEALAAERSRERLANLAAAEAAAEAARERARQLREARSQELRKREEERRRNADERRKALQTARQDRTVPTIGRGTSVVTNSGLSKSLRIRPVNGRVASSYLPRGFASELDPSDPRYCPYGFGSSCRREVCLTTSQLVKARNDQNRRHLLTTSFTADVKRSFHVPDKRMTTSATVNYSRPLGLLDTRGAKHELTNKSAIQSQSDATFKATTSKSQPRKLPEIRSMRIPPSLLKSTEASGQEKSGQKAFDKTSVSSAKSRTLPTFVRQKPTYAVNNPKPTRMSVSTRKPPNRGDVKMPTAVPLGRCQPRKLTSQQTASRLQNPPSAQSATSLLSVKACADRPLSPSTALRDSVEGGLQVATTEAPTKSITSVRGGAEPSDEEVAEYRARMKEQRRLALERREEEEMAISKETEQRVEQEAMNVIIREIAEVTVGEAIDQAIAELKAEAIQAAVLDEQTEQVQQHNSQNLSHSPSRLPQKAAFRLETAMQGLSMIPPAGEAITVSPVPAEGDPTVVLRSSSTLINRSLSANDLQPASESDKNLIQAIVTTSKDRLNKGIEEMATAVGEKWDKNAQTLALRTLSNVTAEAAEREERKRRLQQVMLRIRTPHGSSASLAAEDGEANSPGPDHFFADSAQPDDHPGDQPLTPPAHRSPIQFKPNALLSVLESGRLPKNSRAAALLRERVTSPTVFNTPKNHDGNIPSEVTKTAESSQDGGPVDLTSDEDGEEDRSSTPIQGLPALTTDLVTPVKPPHQMADSGAAGEETNGEEEARTESTAKEEKAGGVPQNGAQLGLDEEQDIPLSLSALGPEHSAVLRHSILVRDPQSKLSHADLEVFNAVGDASPREFSFL